MKEKIRNSFTIFLLLLPILALNIGFLAYFSLEAEWARADQERFADRKLNEISSDIDFSHWAVQLAAKFNKDLSNLINSRHPHSLDKEFINHRIKNIFKKPFPTSRVWVIKSDKKTNRAKVFIKPAKTRQSSRIMSMLMDYLIAITKNKQIAGQNKRRNEKLLQKVFGSGSIGKVLALDQRGIATPIIVAKTPGVLIWDYVCNPEGESLGFFLIADKVEDFQGVAYQLIAEKAGLGKKYAGGFLNLFETGHSDFLFPASLNRFEPFKKIRNTLKTCSHIENLREYEKTGFWWNKKLGNMRIFTRILLGKKMLAFLVLPEIKTAEIPVSIRLFSSIWLLICLAAIVRGFLLGIWPLNSLNSRFVTVYLLAIILPIALFTVAAKAYLFQAQKNDINRLEESLIEYIEEFDAGQEQLESNYLARFQKMIRDKSLIGKLRQSGAAENSEIIPIISSYFRHNSDPLPLSSIAVFDLYGEGVVDFDKSSLRGEKSKTILNFFRTPMTYNLRRHFSVIKPLETLKEYKPDQKSLLAYEAYGKENKTLDYELERFKSRCFRTDFGHEQAVYLQDFIYIDGVPKYSILVSWQDIDIEQIVLNRSAAKLGFKNPQIKIIALKKEKKGIRFALKPDRGFNAKMEKNFSELGRIAFGKDRSISSMVKDGMTILAYSSKNFSDLVFVAGINHFQIQLDELKRKFVILLVGLVSLAIIIAMALITYFRVIFPLKSIKAALENIQKGKLDFDFKTNRNDEVGLLTREFSSMVTGLRERARLASMLSDQAVEVISSHNSMDSEIKDVKHTGVVLISDIRSFTTLCEEYNPKEITEMLNTHFAEMAKIIVANGGRIYKFIGDAIEAVFLNDEKKIETASQRAFKASVDMLKRLEEINELRRTRQNFTYKIGIGLAAGNIFCGGIGSSETRYDYAMLGTAFKRAEAFEAMTKPYTDCPLIFDAEISTEIEADWTSKISVDESDESAFRLETLPDKYLGEKADQVSYRPESDAEKKQAGSQSLVKFLGRNEKLIRWLIFFVSAICVFAPFYGVIQAKYFKIKDFERQELSKTKADCKTVITRYKVARFQDLFLEEFIAKSVNKFEKTLSWTGKGTNPKELGKVSQHLLNSLESVGISPETFMVVNCDAKLATQKEVSEHEKFDLSQCNFSFEKGLTANRRAYLELLRCFISCELRGSLEYEKKAAIEQSLAELTGKGSVLSYCLKDSYARLSPVSRYGKDQFMYWRCLGSWRTDDPDVESERASKLHEKPGVDNYQLAGALMMFIPRENKDSAFIKIAKKLMLATGFECAFINEKSKCVEASKGFPAKSSLKYGEKILSTKDWIFETAKIKLKQGKFQIFLTKPIKKGSWESFSSLIVTLSIVILVILYIFWRAIFHETGIAQRFAVQFWLCLLAASIFPLTGVFMMNEWHSVEQKNLNLKLERQKLLSSFDELERRQLLREVLDTERIDKFTASADFIAEFLKTNKSADIKDIKAFESFLNNVLKPEGIDSGPVRFHEMSVISSSNWEQKIYSRENSQRKASTFNLFVTAIAKQIFKDLGVHNPYRGNKKSNLAKGVKEEMTMDAGLGLSRMLFGPDVYFKLVHGVNDLVTFSAAGGFASIKMIPIPSILNPIGIAFWYRLDQLHPTIREIVKNFDSNYAVFSESATMYASMKRAADGGWFKTILDYARWTVATRVPLSERVKIGDANYLLEARDGKYQNSTLFIGLASEKTVLRKIEERRRSALLFILIALLATVFLAVIVIADINVPINQLTYAVKQVEGLNLHYRLTESRKDELGELFLAFNSMIKGLAEKELMGKMVSKTARLAASDEQNAQSAEAGMNLNVAIMYVSVPKFNFVLETTEPETIIRDLKGHIDTLCGIILNNGGDIDKIIGDKLLAVFYDPDSMSNSSNMALKAIREIRLADREGKLNFPVCLGLHAGTVIAGLLGVGNHRDFTVIGDPVNTAARIAGEAANLPRENYLLSQSIVTLLPDSSAEFKAFGEVELKGKAEPLKLFRIS